MKKVTVSVPASSANLGPGFDCLGLAVALRNTVEFYEINQGLEIDIEGEGEGDLPTDPTNLIVRAADLVFERVNRRPTGLRVHTVNTIPLSSGLGSSAAAIVGGLAAANALVDAHFSRDELLRLALELEPSPDNVSAALFGGMTMCSYSNGELMCKPFAVPQLKVALVLPDMRISTAQARAVLPAHVPHRDAVFNMGRALFVAQAIPAGDLNLLQWAMSDRLHQPYRKDLLPGFDEVVMAARKAGAAAVALSGSGPAIIAFCVDKHWEVAKAMQAAFAAHQLKSRAFVLNVDRQGVQVQMTMRLNA